MTNEPTVTRPAAFLPAVAGSLTQFNLHYSIIKERQSLCRCKIDVINNITSR